MSNFYEGYFQEVEADKLNEKSWWNFKGQLSVDEPWVWSLIETVLGKLCYEEC